MAIKANWPSLYHGSIIIASIFLVVSGWYFIGGESDWNSIYGLFSFVFGIWLWVMLAISYIRKRNGLAY